MTYFWWILGVCCVLCFLTIFLIDIRDLDMEEEESFDKE